jgi:hypothetical protein
MGELISSSVSIDGEYLLLHPSKSGLYFLRYVKSPGQTEMLAEIEFLDREEVKAELRFIKESSMPVDSVNKQQLKYIRKVYPKIPDSQLQTVFSGY